MAKFIKERVKNVGHASEERNITSTTPVKLVCIYFLSRERSKGGSENILLITDHFSHYVQAIPTRYQTAATTTKALYENFFVHYEFPAKLHSYKGANLNLFDVIKNTVQYCRCSQDQNYSIPSNGKRDGETLQPISAKHYGNIERGTED